MDLREYRTLILAGLLHDVGKLLNKPQGGAHEQIGEEFLRSAPYADLLRQPKFTEDLDFDLLCHLVRWHAPYGGAPSVSSEYQSLQRRLSRADGLSSGERSWEMQPRSQWSSDRPLDTIFNSLQLGRPLSSDRLRYKPVPLHPRAVFPRRLVASLEEADYQDVIQGFRDGFQYALEEARNWRELESWIYALLERYAWAVPSDVRRERPEVSLFDHARTSCAIAAALVIRDQPEFDDVRPARSTFLLIQGDISGVQDYVYGVANIGPGGVAKRLRARSFFVTALTEVVAHWLRDDLVPGYPLPIAAQIMSGGAQFVLLAPDLPPVRERLVEIRHTVNQWLWENFQGDLALIIESLSLTQNQLLIEEGNICQMLNELKLKVQAAKQQRLGDLLQDEGGWVEEAFKWEVKPYPYGECPSCARLPVRPKAVKNAPAEDGLCERCYRDRLLSERIVDANYVAYFRGPRPGLVGDQDEEWVGRRTLTLFEDEDNTRQVLLLASLEDLDKLDRRPYQLDGFGYGKPTSTGPALVRHFANHVPRWQIKADLEVFCTPERGCVHVSYEKDETCGILIRPDGSRVHPHDFPILQTFGCISAASAEWPDGSLGSQFLGILRADADHLGLLFGFGLGEAKSLSRLATLSRMTDLFFSGWVNHVLAMPPEGKRYDHIYTVYSGGDDLCLVGPWDVIIDFAHHLGTEFERFVGGNPNVTLSAAVTVTKPKFPIATSAKQAGLWLDERAKGEGRNRLHLFGVTVHWRDLPPREGEPFALSKLVEMPALRWDDLWPWADLLDRELRRWREAETARYPVSTAFAHRLLGYAERARLWEREERINAEDMLYLARLAYDLGRNIVKSDAVPQETKRSLNRLTQLTNREIMAGMRLPITYAMYRNRERSRER